MRRNDLMGLLAGLAIGGTMLLILHPLYVKEQERHKEIECEYVQELKEADKEYEAEVAAEKARWAAIEGEEAKAVTAEYITTAEDIAEEGYWDELSLLAEIVEAEAGGEDLEGKRLVVDVILNRVDSDLFPDSITEVIYQGYQLSSVLDGGLDRAGWRMQDDDYTAVLLELEERTDSSILYFTAGAYGEYGTPAYQHGNHYFSR